MAGEVVTLTATATGTEPIEFAWAFGDGTTGYGTVVTHTYTLSDTYTVVLTATNDCGEQIVEHNVAVYQEPERYYVYLPIVLKSYAP
jgi:PKD repeat protein